MADIHIDKDIIAVSSGEYNIYKLRFYLNGVINGLSNFKIGSKIEINQSVYENLQDYIKALKFLYDYLEIEDDEENDDCWWY